MKQTEFNRKLREQLDDISDIQGYDLNNSTQQGMAFQYWYSELSSNMEGGFDTETEDAMLSANDGGVDLVHSDFTDKKLLLVQTKYRSLKSNKTESWNDIEPFFKKHKDWLNDDYLKTLSRNARENLDIYKKAVKEKWSIEYRYVTTHNVNDDLKNKVEVLEGRLDLDNIHFELIGRDGLRDFLTEAEFAEEGIQDQVEINLLDNRFSHWVDGEQEVVIGVVSGKSYCQIWCLA